MSEYSASSDQAPQAPPPSPIQSFGWWLGCALLIAATTWVRLWFIRTGQLNLAPDEAQYWDWSRTLQWSYYSKGPLIAYINRLGDMLFGATELGVRAGALAGSVLMQVVAVAWIGGLLKRPRLAFWMLALLNTTLLFIAGSLLMTTDNPLLVCWMLALVCLYFCLERGGRAAWIGLSLCLVVGIWAKYTMLFFLPLALLASLWVGRDQNLPARFWRNMFKTLAVGACIGLVPIVVWNAGHDWVGLKHVLYRGALAGDKAAVFFKLKHFPEYLGSQFGVLTPWWLIFVLFGAWNLTRQLCSRSPQADLYGVPRSVAIVLVVFFWPVWIGFVLWSLHAKVEANWSAACYPAGIILGALALERSVHEVRSKWRFAWPGLGLLVFLLLHGQGFLPFDGPKNPVHRLLGWQDLGAQVHTLLEEELGGSDVAFVCSDEYGVTAELSFYVPGQKRAFCLAGGRKMNQYDLWAGPGPEYENALFVVKGNKTAPPEHLVQLFERIDGPRSVATTHGQRQGQSFTVFLCFGFQGNWPVPEQDVY